MIPSSRTSRTRRVGWPSTAPTSRRGRTPCSATRSRRASRASGAARSSRRCRASCAAAGRSSRARGSSTTSSPPPSPRGCTRVVNLAAGLDTRPYRLPLPASLTWLEADLPALVDEKERLLAGETPVCAVTRARVDLADAAARAAFLAGVAGDAQTLVITEGLVQYLDDATVAALARDVAACAPVRWWIVDFISPGALAMIKRTRGHRAARMMGFAPRNGVAFFEAVGWRAREVRSIVREAVRLRRAPWLMRAFAWVPDPDPRAPGAARWFAVARLERG